MCTSGCTHAWTPESQTTQHSKAEDQSRRQAAMGGAPGGEQPIVSLNPAVAAAKSLQSCPTLCDPIDCSPPGSPVPGILQARTLEWVAISFSSAWKWKVKVKSLSRVRLFATPWTAAYQAPPSMGFSRQEYWSGVPLPSPNPAATPFPNLNTTLTQWLLNSLLNSSVDTSISAKI